MTIRQLFEELRMEPDWDKEIKVICNDETVPLGRPVPNLVGDDILIALEGNERRSEFPEE